MGAAKARALGETSMKTFRLVQLLAVQAFLALVCYLRPENRLILLIGIVGVSAVILLLSRRLRIVKDYTPTSANAEILSKEAGNRRLDAEAHRAEVFSHPLAVLIVQLKGQDAGPWSTLKELDKVAIASHAVDIMLQELSPYDVVVDCGEGFFLVLMPEMNTTAVELADELMAKLDTTAPGGTDFRASILVEVYKPGGPSPEFVRQVRAVLAALE
jgi:hypothetical protein